MTETTDKTKTVVITDNLLLQMAGKTDYVAILPGLLQARAAQATVGKCAACQRAKAAMRLRANLSSVKRDIAHMSDDSKRKLKALLGAGKVRVMYRNPGNKGVVERTF